MRKMVVAAVVTLVGVVGFIPPATAGGYDMFTEGRKYFAPGESVSWETSVYVQGLKGAEDGPWYAYLRPATRRAWDGRLDEDAVRVGTVEITDDADDDSYIVASLDFTVPAGTKPGYYTMQVCNAPHCRKWLGALGPTGLGVARTPVEAHLLRRVERLKSDIFTLRYQQRRAPGTGEVRGMVSTVRAALTDARAESTTATNGLENELAALEARLARSEEQPLLGPSEWLLIALIVLLGASLLVRRSRLPRSSVPNLRTASDPDELGRAG